MNKKEKLFVAKLLRMAANEFSNHGCNDLPEECEKLFTKKEWTKMMKDYHEWNGDPEEFEGGFESHMLMDWLWMDYFANILETEVE